jgi:hypothetical protein
MRTARTSEQESTDPWLTLDSQQGIEETLLELFKEEYWVYDSDDYGECVYEAVVRENDVDRFFSVTHSWWIRSYPEWRCMNDFSIEEQDSVKFYYPSRDRDWLVLKKKGY